MKNLEWLALLLTFLVTACGTQSRATSESPAELAQPYSSLAQVMRGILYPSSEIIFDTQTRDPEAEEPEPEGALPGPYTEDLYGGWEGVEYAALMLSEAANLILIPGRLCENGLPVPLDNEDFRRYAEGLVEAGRVAYEAAQTRDMDAMIEASGVVSDACFFCHDVYRDKPEGEMRCIAPDAAGG